MSDIHDYYAQEAEARGPFVPKPRTTPAPAPGKFDPYNYQTSRDRAQHEGQGRINPYDDEYNRQQAAWGANTHLIPGQRPDVGVANGNNYYNLVTGDQIAAQDYGKWDIDAVTHAFAQLAPNVAPTHMSQVGKGKVPSGRGYSFNAQTPEEMALQQRFMSGDHSVGPALARMRAGRITRNKPSALQRFGSGVFAPALGAGVTALAGMAGPWVGAGMGAMVAGNMSKWKDPAAVAIGAGGGALGGWGISKIPGIETLPRIAQGAATGVGGAVGSSIPRNAMAGNFDPAVIGRDAALGAAGGAAGAALPDIYGPAVRMGASAVGNGLWPRKRPRNPYDVSDR